MVKKKRLGDILVEAGFISEEQLQEALDVQTDSDKRLGEVLKELGMITEQDIVEALEFQLGIPKADLKKFIIDEEAINSISKTLASKHQVIPINKKNNVLTVAMADPLNVIAIDDIRVQTGCEVNPVIAKESEIQSAIDQYFSNTDEVEELVDDINFELDSGVDSDAELNRLREMVDDAPVVRLVNNIINDGISFGASDIHIEPLEEEVRVRYRIDGILHKEMSLPKHTHAALVSRIKIMGELDIAERRLPQDGRIQIAVSDNREIDLRVSTLPTVKGEKVVLRILDKENLKLNLGQLGFLEKQRTLFAKMINKSYGMVLITGPTGSGKTTTLYSALSTLNCEEDNLITVEDPVEYQLDGINQVATKPKAGLGFATVLRSILRQDPDTIMIGEIRDQETAKIATNAALTGHLVFSTLHTNTAAGALSRLADMGVQDFLIASAVIGVVSQRLVRKICENCKVVDNEISEKYDLEAYLGSKAADFKLYRGEGCRVCNDTGYDGRTAIHELLTVDDKIKKLIVNQASTSEIETAVGDKGLFSIEESGFEKVKQGITTLEEVLRVTQA